MSKTCGLPLTRSFKLPVRRFRFSFQSSFGIWVTMKKFLHYDVGEKLGEGKNGATYVAWDPGLDRVVAIKLLSQESTLSEDWRTAFHAEAARINETGSPRLARFYSLEDVDDQTGLIREYVQGRSIKQLVADQTIEFDLFLEVAIEATKGLMDFQARDMTHRNITSNNIIYAKEGLVKLVDGHLDRPVDSKISSEDLTYLAPELIEGRTVDRRADMYSLGVVLYHLLTGNLPYANADTASLRDRILSGRDLFPAAESNRYPGDARLLIETLMAKDPGERFGGADELLLTLREMIHFNQSRAEVLVEKRPKFGPRQYLSVSLLVLLLVVLWFVVAVYNR